MSAINDRPIFRFAPSPNGYLHLGHAYSALLNQQRAREMGGRMLLRLEDIDTVRCTPQLEAELIEDLHCIGFEWVGHVRRQSEHFDDYRAALDILIDAGLAYHTALSRGDLRAMVVEKERTGGTWPRDPDGAPLFPGRDYQTPATGDDPRGVWRLDVKAALDHLGINEVSWDEAGAGPNGESGTVCADPTFWGDFILARRDTPTSYHLSVVVDDYIQRVTDVVRGRDLYFATAAHALLQDLLGYARPTYFHHDLIMEPGNGRKLSKSQKDTSLRALRASGATVRDIKRMIGVAG
ncbi:MAG: tRNA glutamyl-Q(34) synthetase GluQRS [Pseudomonadota bacterium]